LKDLYIPIQIDELLIEKILNSILKNEYLFLLSILVVVVGLTHLDPIGFFASIPGLNIILEFYTFGFFADVGEDNVRTRWELAIIKFLIMDIEICSFPFNNDSYIGYLINDPHVEQYLLYSIKAIY
jgi:hypothetical protein